MHLNLLNGMLLVDSKPIDGLPHEIRKQALYKRIFGGVRMYSQVTFPASANFLFLLQQVFLAIPSDLPGMDLSTLALISDHRVSDLYSLDLNSIQTL